MNVLLIGSGGREHALAWALSRSPQVEKLFIAPGNGGTANLAKSQNVAIKVDALDELVMFAQGHEIDLTVVGPEAPLVAGIVERFQAAGLRIFGPTGPAAQLEGSKAFSKAFMVRHNLPTGQAEIFDDHQSAVDYLASLDKLPVIKASGLAAGKGVLLPDSLAEGIDVLNTIMIARAFGDAGETVLIEERLDGPEMSVLAFCDGTDFHVMPVAQDHKRLLEDDQGPNTGGMGAIVPAPLATPELLQQVEQAILRPTLDGMTAEGHPYVGVLYAGLMLTADGPQLLEFNCRLGDPEAQVVLPLLETDLVDVINACIDGGLGDLHIQWQNQASATVIMASGGYPASYTKGYEITGIDQAESTNCSVFQAGTKLDDGKLITDGGRVLAVTAIADELSDALKTAYHGVDQINFHNAIYRKDIGKS
ncbi:MAG: phosphoribosylamine--glycine ligase [Chloroflexota bacterium]